jgi:hypothetical protein
MNKEKTKRVAIFFLVTLLVANVCLAQVKPTGPKPSEGKRGEAPLDDTFKLLISKLTANDARLVKGLPYSATAITEGVQSLVDGNQIIQKKEATFYRDSEGRTRIDERLDKIGIWSPTGGPRQIIMISDPIAGFYYNLDPRTRTAIKRPQGPQSKAESKVAEEKLKSESRAMAIEPRLESKAKVQEENAKAREAKAKAIEEKLSEKAKATEAKAAEKANPAWPPVGLVQEPKELAPRKDGTNVNAKKESLGKQTIEGVEAEGTRWTRTIPAHEIGNTLPIEIVNESWYSHELQVMVMTKHRDPRTGEVTWRLTNIRRSEPDRSLFQIPADYTVVDKPTKIASDGPRPKKIPRTNK